MNLFEDYIPLFSKDWKEKYQGILAEEHLKNLSLNIQKFKDKTLDLDLPFFNDEIKIDRDDSFNLFTHILDSENSDTIKVKQLEEIPFEYWLNILGQRLTSASLRDENAIPPLKSLLIEACEKSFNQEITIAQRAWEKHVGRMEDQFWGEVKGNNQQKQQIVMEKINFILDHKTWWNVFFHYKHELVFEVREKDGHGIRWSHGGKNLIGFLEGFMNE
ncbi:MULTISPECIES: hypothetical protein [Chryseobacterium]|uniref:hypothetical protein n=1 Tax=Chryseobacterium TaxID=59732 RepID=UPI0011168731|nr:MULTISPECIES: hypothetical protein [Chryseobacterium]MBM7421688.1 hypothetical protein [Chryseobacterium sp. JUb44]MDH6211656.1 hypothetical protein [Chryseobacterium sp. BIGb0186]WSO10298.1 hypothetical protein VUJ64_21140 [Chryseobacterium scophthalmum]